MPIEIDEAELAIRDSGIATKVWKEKYKIRFEGRGFKGELYHGSNAEAFTRYGLDVSFRNGYEYEEILKTLNKLTAKLYNNERILTDSMETNCASE
ncbi:hypothetical protein MLD52_16255 [Puniceicoccaceae bacterium K14]|nr:hypothetical protein [Puniceicoccaceae bacterium K14]